MTTTIAEGMTLVAPDAVSVLRGSGIDIEGLPAEVQSVLGDLTLEEALAVLELKTKLEQIGDGDLFGEPRALGPINGNGLF